MTIRTKNDLLNNSFRDGQNPDSITASDIRDLVASVQMAGGYAYYENTGSSTVLTDNSTITLTNDAAGTGTYKNWKNPDITDVWNSTTNRFDFTQLDVGDLVEIRIDIEMDAPGPGREIAMELGIALGTSSETAIGFGRAETVNSSTMFTDFSFYRTIFIGSADTRTNPAEIRVRVGSPDITFRVEGILARVVKV